ncbi:MAG: pyridoxal-dependent decarboxylase [Bacteroidota bacterium]
MESTQLKNYLDQVWDLLETDLREENRRTLKSNDPETIKKALSFTLPEQNEPLAQILEEFKHQLLPYLNHNTSPNYGAYITGSGNKIGALAEFIKAYYNQNALKWNNSPIASELEQLVIKWIASFCLVPNHSKGVLTSGGSMSNLMAIHFALASKYPEREVEGVKMLPKLTIYCSDQTHSSVDRAMVFLGLGRNYLRKIPVNDQYQINTKDLIHTIKIDLSNGFRPFLLIGNAGTTNTGSIDPLNELSKVAEAYELWYHIDGAYGLPAVRLDSLKDQFCGLEKADSVIINPHKWMYVPFEASCVLVRKIPQAIHFSPDYLFTEHPSTRWESSNHTIELSKEFRALKIWFTMKYYGANQLTKFVDQDIRLVSYLAKLLKQHPSISVEPSHPLSILCFRYFNPALEEMENERINIQAIRIIEFDGRIFITGTKLKGKTHLRVYFGNPERTKKDVDFMVKVIGEIFEKCEVENYRTM